MDPSNTRLDTCIARTCTKTRKEYVQVGNHTYVHSHSTCLQIYGFGSPTTTREKSYFQAYWRLYGDTSIYHRCLHVMKWFTPVSIDDHWKSKGFGRNAFICCVFKNLKHQNFEVEETGKLPLPPILNLPWGGQQEDDRSAVCWKATNSNLRVGIVDTRFIAVLWGILNRIFKNDTLSDGAHIKDSADYSLTGLGWPSTRSDGHLNGRHPRAPVSLPGSKVCSR